MHMARLLEEDQGAIITHTDITARRMAEDSVTRSIQPTTALDAARLGWWSYDPADADGDLRPALSRNLST